MSQRLLCLFKRKANISQIRNVAFSPIERSFVPTTMKAWQFSDYSGPLNAVLQNDVRVPPITSPSQVLVKVVAASVNPLDAMMSRGYGQTMFDGIKCAKSSLCEHQPKHHFPLVLGRDFSGEVVDVGMGVRNLNRGDEVWGAIWPWDGGSHQEYLAVDASCISKGPTVLSHIDRASIPYAALTAWSALTGPAGLGPDTAGGKRVLVLGGAGGVGVMVVQLLSLWGAKVIATASAGDAGMVSKLGAKVVLDYSSPTLWNELQELSRFDIVLDAAGIGQSSPLLEYQPLVHTGGAVVTLSSPVLNNVNQFGLLGGAVSSLSHMLQQNVNTFKDFRTTRWAFFRPDQSALISLSHLVSSGELKPVVGKVFDFSQAKEAYAAVEEGNIGGKIVITMDM